MSRRTGAEAKRRTTQPAIESLLQGKLAPRYRLRLYVAGNNLNSFKAIENAERLCREHLQGRGELEIVDLYQQPALARWDRIVAAPCLVKLHPGPPRRFIGDLSDTRRVLQGLSLRISKPLDHTNGIEIQRQGQ